MPLFDKKDKSRYATFTRRSLGMGGGMAAVFAVLAGRLYQLQIRDGDQYMVEAEDNRVSERLIAPPRGRIMDRFGVELANSRRNYRVLLVSEQASEGVKAALDTIGKVILLSDQQKKKVMHDIAMNKKFVPVPVAENLSWEEFSRVNLHLPYLPGIQCDVGETRDYPFGTEMVHILGYVASVSPQDMAHDDDPLMSLPGMRIGKRGIEKAVRQGNPRPRRRIPRRSQCLWPRHPRAGQGSRRAGRGCLAHHRRRGAALRRPAPGRRKRRLRGDGRGQWRCPGACPPRPVSIPTGSMSASPARNGAT